MKSFLYWIGLYNVLGALVLAAMHSERIARFMLGKATEISAVPYEHGAWGRMWLWWAASTNGFLGLVMVAATRWDLQAQREVTFAAVGVYAVMYVVVIVGGRGAKWGRGILALHPLWLGQMAWGIWAGWPR